MSLRGLRLPLESLRQFSGFHFGWGAVKDVERFDSIVDNT